MGRFEDINFYKDVRKGIANVYIPYSACDYVEKEKISLDEIYLESNIKDQTEELYNEVIDIMHKIMFFKELQGKEFDSISIKIIPLLLFNINSILKYPNRVIAKKNNIDFFPNYVKLMIDIVSETNGEETYELFDIYKNSKKQDTDRMSIEGIVDYNKFFNFMSLNNYSLLYGDFDTLANEIIRSAGNEDVLLNLEIPVITKGQIVQKTKRFR